MGRNRRKQHSETTAKIESLHLLNRSYATAHTDNVGADSGSISQGLDMAALATKILLLIAIMLLFRPSSFPNL